MPGRDWLLVLLGAIGFIVLSHQIPILRQLESNNPHQLKLEDIEGIDYRTLEILRTKGLF